MYCEKLNSYRVFIRLQCMELWPLFNIQYYLKNLVVDILSENLNFTDALIVILSLCKTTPLFDL